jgi:phosphoglucosamine mutase
MALFGTDGIRAKAGKGLSALNALQIAQSAGIYFAKKGKTKKIILGKDTRISGYMIEGAVVSGLTSVGLNVIEIGPMPTPAIAYLTQSMRCDGGIMLSASHNPYEDNGIKIFDELGRKISLEAEAEIEKIYNNKELIENSQQVNGNIGKAKRMDDVTGRYIVSIKSSFPIELGLAGLKIVLDCANGAAYKVGPTILQELGANVISINDKPDGFNINNKCGAMYPEMIAKKVLEHKADIGIGLDGDADRLVLIDELGNVIEGDKLLGVLSVYLKKNNKLPHNVCVSTVMSNMALDDYLGANDILLKRTKVGDKYIIALMRKMGYKFGGEPSGHIIFKDISKTGDGLAAALQSLALLITSKDGINKNKNMAKASEVFNPFKLYPCININMQIIKKIPLKDIKELENIKKENANNSLREVIRYSGTENKVRILVEGKNKQTVEKYAKKVEDILKKELC